jgi:hypothetical protein
MRWENLFDDLEGQLEQEISAEELDLRVEEERTRVSRLTIRDRLVAAHAGDASDPIRLSLGPALTVTIRASSVGRDWVSAELVGETDRTRACVIPVPAISSISLTREQAERSLRAVPDDSPRASLPGRLGFAFVLRDLCRRRVAVDVRTNERDFHGTIDRVGRDHLDLAIHEPDSFRRQSAVTQIRVIPFDGLLMILLPAP